MAKLKTYAVEVEVRHTITLFVDARRPGGAEQKVREDEGAWDWSDDFPAPRRFDPKTMTVTRVREMGS